MEHFIADDNAAVRCCLLGDVESKGQAEGNILKVVKIL
jgi:hypothetical protein